MIFSLHIPVCIMLCSVVLSMTIQIFIFARQSDLFDDLYTILRFLRQHADTHSPWFLHFIFLILIYYITF